MFSLKPVICSVLQTLLSAFSILSFKEQSENVKRYKIGFLKT